MLITDSDPVISEIKIRRPYDTCMVVFFMFNTKIFS